MELGVTGPQGKSTQIQKAYCTTDTANTTVDCCQYLYSKDVKFQLEISEKEDIFSLPKYTDSLNSVHRHTEL